MGFMQITAGVDYTVKFAPTVTDEGQRPIFIVILYFKNEVEEEEPDPLDPWTIDKCDMEAIYFESRQDKPMYIKMPAALAAYGFLTKDE